MIGNYEEEFMTGVKEKVEKYAHQYRDLYTRCYTVLENNVRHSLKGTVMKGAADAAKNVGAFIGKIPIVSKGPVDEALAAAGENLSDINDEWRQKTLKRLVALQTTHTQSFSDNIQALTVAYNEKLQLCFDKENLYFANVI